MPRSGSTRRSAHLHQLIMLRYLPRPLSTALGPVNRFFTTGFLLAPLAVLSRLPGPTGQALAAHWLRTWKQAVPGSDPARAWQLLRPLAALRLAVVYQHFLDNIEPAERVYHEHDVQPALQTAARLAVTT